MRDALQRILIHADASPQDFEDAKAALGIIYDLASAALAEGREQT